MRLSSFEENTGSFVNRHHIIYPQITPLSSPFPKKTQKYSSPHTRDGNGTDLESHGRHAQQKQTDPGECKSEQTQTSRKKKPNSERVRKGWDTEQGNKENNREKNDSVRENSEKRITTPQSCTRRFRRRGHSMPGEDRNICRPADQHCTGSSRRRRQCVS